MNWNTRDVDFALNLGCYSNGAPLQTSQRNLHQGYRVSGQDLRSIYAVPPPVSAKPGGLGIPAFTSPPPVWPPTDKFNNAVPFYQTDKPRLREECPRIYFNKSSLHPRDSLSSGNQAYDFIHNDVESDKTCDVITALVNKLLDDVDNDYLPDEDIPHKSGSWNVNEESIGALAIQLADLSILEDPLSMKPTVQSSFPQEMNFPGQRYAPQGLPVMRSLHDNAFQLKANGLQSSLSAQNTEASKTNSFSEELRTGMKRSGYYKKKKMTGKPPRWSAPVSKLTPSFHAEARMAPSAGNQTCYHAMRKPLYPPPKRCGGSFWMQLPTNGSTGSKSDSSSSSNSSVHKESTIRPSELMKFKVPIQANNFEGGSSKPVRRPRKSYSSCSSSSGGQGKYLECVFCKTNGETSAMYRGHVLKDEHGLTVCKVLQKYICPLCGATGVNAHTVKYCPKNKNPPPVATMTTLKSMRTSTGRKRYGPCPGQAPKIPFGFNRNLLSA